MYNVCWVETLPGCMQCSLLSPEGADSAIPTIVLLLKKHNTQYTRKHFSRMHTARLLTVVRGVPPFPTHTHIPSHTPWSHNSPLPHCILGYTPPLGPLHAGIHTPLPHCMLDTHLPLPHYMLGYTPSPLLHCMLRYTPTPLGTEW